MEKEQDRLLEIAGQITSVLGKRYSIKGWIVLIGIIVAIVVFVIVSFMTKEEKPAEVFTVATLEEIIDVSELSTFSAVYNGVVKVMNEDNPDAVDYYVSYEAKVNAGIDIKKIDPTMDEETKTIHIPLPPIEINEVSVDITSLDFIFYNNGTNTSAVTEEAFKACEEDVKKESKNQKAIIDLAEQNAKNVLTALVEPLVEQFYPEYTLVVE
jgi:hypothetical protein